MVFRRPGRDRGEGGRPLSGKEVVPELGTGVRDVEREKEIAQRPADDPGVRVEDEDGQAPAGRGRKPTGKGPVTSCERPNFRSPRQVAQNGVLSDDDSNDDDAFAYYPFCFILFFIFYFKFVLFFWIFFEQICSSFLKVEIIMSLYNSLLGFAHFHFQLANASGREDTEYEDLPLVNLQRRLRLDHGRGLCAAMWPEAGRGGGGFSPPHPGRRENNHVGVGVQELSFNHYSEADCTFLTFGYIFHLKKWFGKIIN